MSTTRTRTALTGLLAATASCAAVMATVVPTTAAPAAAPTWETPETVARMVPAGAAVARTGAMATVLSDGDEVFVVERPAGGSWGAPESVGPGEGGGWAQVAYDKAGHLVVAWADNTDAGTTVYSRRTMDDGTWDTTELVATRVAGESVELELAVSPAGAAVLGWNWLAPGGSRLLISSRPVLGSWSATTRLGAAGVFHLALGPSRHAALAVSTVRARGGDTTEVLTLFRRGQDGTWGDPEPITRIPDITFSVGLPDVAVDRYGTTMVVWRDQATDGRWQVLAARARADHPLRTPRVVATDTGLAYESGPQAAAPATGNDVVLVSWTRGNGALMGVRWLQGGPQTNWGPVMQLAPGADDVLFWSTAMDDHGRAVAVWTKGGWFGDDGQGVQARRMNAWGDWGPTTQVTLPRARVLLPFAGQGTGDSLAVWWQRMRGDRWVARASADLTP